MHFFYNTFSITKNSSRYAVIIQFCLNRNLFLHLIHAYFAYVLMEISTACKNLVHLILLVEITKLNVGTAIIPYWILVAVSHADWIA